MRARERGKPPEISGGDGPLPDCLEIRDESRHEDQVQRTGTQYLVRDVDGVHRRCVMGLGDHADSLRRSGRAPQARLPTGKRLRDREQIVVLTYEWGVVKVGV
jgi:hypothetical protein